jgi:hypothetical protein
MMLAILGALIGLAITYVSYENGRMRGWREGMEWADEKCDEALKKQKAAKDER